MELYPITPARFARLLEQSGVSQGELARLTDTDQGQISRYVTGRKDVNVRTMNRWLEVLLPRVEAGGGTQTPAQ